MTIEHVLQAAREQTATLRLYGQQETADAVDGLLDRVAAALRGHLQWHDEAGAVLLSGKPAGFFRARFADWERRGLARYAGRGRRLYRETVIPFRADTVSAAEAGRQAAAADAGVAA